MKAIVVAATLVMLLAASDAVAQGAPTREAHGALDAYATDGLAMAWAVMRGRDEQSTRVVVLVDADTATFRALSITGVDPFTQATVPLQPLRALGGPFQFFAPRARFADHPRTEWRFYREAAPAAGAAPALLVYYQGIPDTTPEFDDAGKLDSYLAQRLQKARSSARGTKP